MSQDGVTRGHAQNHVLKNQGCHRATVLTAVLDPAVLCRGNPHRSWVSSLWLTQHEGSTPLSTTPRTCLLWGSSCSRQPLKQAYTQVGTRRHTSSFDNHQEFMAPSAHRSQPNPGSWNDPGLRAQQMEQGYSLLRGQEEPRTGPV